MGWEQNILSVFKHSLVPRIYYSHERTYQDHEREIVRPVSYHFICLSSGKTRIYQKRNGTKNIDRILTEVEITLKIALSDGEV